ncbi:MAG: DNA mismatch repair endonuclease MutL [Candidatus Methylomirabilis sp.]|nr:DNA mismatch repair endonuclease MutL [Deltaproteobacteria bacterium]
MKRIRLLDKSLASKIAAGEVVERPESVLKELLENSIDAGAMAISVTVAEGGKRLIRVVDNGCGISREDASLAFARHATSKIESEEDLERIMTMGFRGEALSSISAVSIVTLRTRPPGEVEGTRVVVEGGGEPIITSDGCPEGTSIEVKDLFYNTPARLKFMRGAESEYGRILDTFRKIALINPDKRLRIVHGSGRPLEALPGTLRQRIIDLFGPEIGERLAEVETPDLTGFIGMVDLSFPTARHIHTFVNGRWVRDRSVNRAILEGYGGLLGGRYPFAVLDLKIPPEDVDVNIHPAKSEVRFRNQGYIYDLVRFGIRDALAARARPAVSAIKRRETVPYIGRGERQASALNEPAASYQFTERPVQLGLSEVTELTEDVKNPEFLDLEVIGQLWGEFIVAQSPENGGEAYLIDQHGAAERCAFEALKKRLASGSIRSQALLLPERIETTPGEKELILKSLKYLSEMGFELMPFGQSTKAGGETFLLKSVPDLLAGRSSASLIKDMAEELSIHGGSRRAEERVESVLMRIACHSVIRGPRPLRKEEAQALLKEMAMIDFAGHCPHGRPVVKRLSRTEIESFFGR